MKTPRPKTKTWAIASRYENSTLRSLSIDEASPRIAVNDPICSAFLRHIGVIGYKRALFEISNRPLKGGFEIEFQSVYVMYGGKRAFVLGCGVHDALWERFGLTFETKRNLYLRVTKLA